MTRTATDKRIAFRALHETGCFVIPNPWDVGSALMLQGLGFAALATTSSGLAWSQGKPDGASTREDVLAHLRTMCAATDLPINADFESGYATDAAGVAESVRLAIDTGVAGLDAPSGFPCDQGAENFIVGRPDLADTLVRLEAYAEAGADCLYAPGIRTREEIEAVVRAVAPKPVNLLIGWPSDLTLADVAALGVRRISVGGALARSAWGGFLAAARGIAEGGQFSGLTGTSGGELNGFFRDRKSG